MLDPAKGIGLFTDGSSWAKDKSGGWAYIAIDNFDHEVIGQGYAEGTTNNRMEMMAWIEGLDAIYEALGPCQIIVFSDSQYVGYGAMDRNRSRVANKDLWKQLDKVIDQHYYVEFCHVKGHSDNTLNNRVDRLASEARRNHVSTKE